MSTVLHELERAHYDACEETDYYSTVYAETGCPDAKRWANLAAKKRDQLADSIRKARAVPTTEHL